MCSSSGRGAIWALEGAELTHGGGPVKGVGSPAVFTPLAYRIAVALDEELGLVEAEEVRVGARVRVDLVCEPIEGQAVRGVQDRVARGAELTPASRAGSRLSTAGSQRDPHVLRSVRTSRGGPGRCV